MSVVKNISQNGIANESPQGVPSKNSANFFTKLQKPFTKLINKLKAQHLLPQKITPQMVFGALVFLLLIVGSASAMLLSSLSQDVRQQASGNPYSFTCTQSGYTECRNGVIHTCTVPGSQSQPTSEVCGEEVDAQSCAEKLGSEYAIQKENCENRPSGRWNDTQCACGSSEAFCYVKADQCATFSLYNCSSSEPYATYTACRDALAQEQIDEGGDPRCTAREDIVCQEAGGYCNFNFNTGKPECIGNTAGSACLSDAECQINGGNQACINDRCVNQNYLESLPRCDTAWTELSSTVELDNSTFCLFEMGDFSEYVYQCDYGSFINEAGTGCVSDQNFEEISSTPTPKADNTPKEDVGGQEFLCYEYDVRNNECIYRSEYNDLSSCRDAFNVAGNYSFCTNLMNNPNQVSQEVSQSAYGSVPCNGGGLPGTCEDRLGLLQICRFGAWSAPTPYEVANVCTTETPEPSEAPTVEVVEVVVTPTAQCYFGVSSCSNIGRESSSACNSCPIGSASCCGSLIDTSDQICKPASRSCNGSTLSVCNIEGTGFNEIECDNGCSNGICLSNQCTPNSCTENGYVCDATGRISTVRCETLSQESFDDNESSEEPDEIVVVPTNINNAVCNVFSFFGVEACPDEEVVEEFSTTVEIAENGRDCAVPHGEFACLASTNCAVCNDGSWLSDQDQRNCYNLGACGVDPSLQTTNQSESLTLEEIISNGLSGIGDSILDLLFSSGSDSTSENDMSTNEVVTQYDPEELVGPSGNVCYCANESGLNYQCENQTLCCDVVRYTSFTQNSSACNPVNYEFGENGIEVSILPDGSMEEPLPEAYVPPNLVSAESVLLQPDVASAVGSFVSAAGEQGYLVVVNSGYRSYDYQNQLYTDCENQGGYPNCLVAPAGYSQHQTGRAVDMYIMINGEYTSISPLSSLANSFGLYQTIPGDTPHFYKY